MFTLDRETVLTPIGEGRYTCKASDVYWNFTGVFGGWINALAIEAIRQIETFRGDVIALNTVFLAGIKEGEVTLTVKLQAARTQIDFWRIEVFQDGAPCANVEIIAGQRRETSRDYMLEAPEVAEPDSVLPLDAGPMVPRWFAQFDQRFVAGDLLTESPEARNTVWVREKDQRPVDTKSLAMMADTPMPRTFFSGNDIRMGASITLSVYFYASPEALREAADDYLLVNTYSASVRKGAYDQRAEIWSRTGSLLAVSNQIAFFR